MKYPIKINGLNEYVGICIKLDNGNYQGGRLLDNGDEKITGFAEHPTIESCMIPISAHNQRIGLSTKKAEKLIKKIKNVKKEKEDKERRKSQKGKKTKKGKKKQAKKVQKRNKSKNSKAKGFFRA